MNSENNPSNATLSTTNPTWTLLGSNSCLCTSMPKSIWNCVTAHCPKVGLCDLHAVCESPINFWKPEPIFMKFGISWHLRQSQRRTSWIPPISLCVCVSLLSLLGKGLVKCISPFIARKRLGKQVPAAKNIRNNRGIVGRAYLWICLCIILSLLGNNSVKTFPRQRRTVGGVVFQAVRALPKESLWVCASSYSC
jgi:hypothetical protein